VILGLPWSSALLLFAIPGLILAAMFYFSWLLKKGRWN
jgi:hypothetical protein